MGLSLCVLLHMLLSLSTQTRPMGGNCIALRLGQTHHPPTMHCDCLALSQILQRCVCLCVYCFTFCLTDPPPQACTETAWPYHCPFKAGLRLCVYFITYILPLLHNQSHSSPLPSLTPGGDPSQNPTMHCDCLAFQPFLDFFFLHLWPRHHAASILTQRLPVVAKPGKASRCLHSHSRLPHRGITPPPFSLKGSHIVGKASFRLHSHSKAPTSWPRHHGKELHSTSRQAFWMMTRPWFGFA